MTHPSLHLVILVPVIGDIELSAKGDIPRAGFLGPITLRITESSLPPGRYEIRTIAHGGRAFHARPHKEARRAEAENKLREIVQLAIELVDRLGRPSSVQSSEQFN